MMRYKSSMFNYVFESGKELVLFNSLKGLSFAYRIHHEHCEQVKKLLQRQKVGIEADDNDEIIASLINKGFLVEETVDEKQRREALYADIIDRSANNLRLIILPTEQCNYRCKYCYESFRKGKMTEETQEAIVKYIRRNITKYSGLRISWFGGEPLLALDVIEKISTKVMDICKKARRKYVADITTNGYLLSLDTFKKLLSLNVLEYQITIDGVKEVHDSKKPLVNGGGTFDIVTNNLRMIKQEVKSSTFSIVIRSNVTDDALLSMDEFTTYFNELLRGDARFSFFLRPAGDWGGNNRLSEMTHARISDNQIGCVYRNFYKNGYPLNVYTHQSFYYPGGCMCYATFINMYVICSDGNLRKCTCELDDEEYSIGRLLPNGNLEIYKEKSDRWTGNRVRFLEKCDECAFSPLCFGACCPQINIFEQSKEHVGEPKCPSEKENLFETLKLIESCNRFPYLDERTKGK